MSTRTDIHHGRQGGHWLPDDCEGSPLDNATPCDVCGQPVIAFGRKRHFACDERSIVGRACTCNPGCTTTRVGDQGTCKPDCEVCSLMKGRPYDEVDGWKKSKKNDDDQDGTDEAVALTLWSAS